MSALPWFAVWSDFSEHPKTLRLCARLADPNAGMYVIRLLAYCARYAQDGRIPGDMLEHAAGWKRRSSLSQVLLECGFIEAEEDRWKLHGWAERNGAHVRKHAKDNARPSAPRRNPDKTPRGVSAGSRAGEERRGEEKKEEACASNDARPEALSLLPDEPNPSAVSEEKVRHIAPQVEAFEYWKANVWPRISGATCPEPGKGAFVRLAALCKHHGLAEVKEAMERAASLLASDPWVRENLSLPHFVSESNFAKYLPRGRASGAPVTSLRKL